MSTATKAFSRWLKEIGCKTKEAKDTSGLEVLLADESLRPFFVWLTKNVTSSDNCLTLQESEKYKKLKADNRVLEEEDFENELRALQTDDVERSIQTLREEIEALKGQLSPLQDRVTKGSAAQTYITNLQEQHVQRAVVRRQEEEQCTQENAYVQRLIEEINRKINEALCAMSQCATDVSTVATQCPQMGDGSAFLYSLPLEVYLDTEEALLKHVQHHDEEIDSHEGKRLQDYDAAQADFEDRCKALDQLQYTLPAAMLYRLEMQSNDAAYQAFQKAVDDFDEGEYRRLGEAEARAETERLQDCNKKLRSKLSGMVERILNPLLREMCEQDLSSVIKCDYEYKRTKLQTVAQKQMEVLTSLLAQQARYVMMHAALAIDYDALRSMHQVLHSTGCNLNSCSTTFQDRLRLYTRMIDQANKQQRERSHSDVFEKRAQRAFRKNADVQEALRRVLDQVKRLEDERQEAVTEESGLMEEMRINSHRLMRLVSPALSADDLQLTIPGMRVAVDKLQKSAADLTAELDTRMKEQQVLKETIAANSEDFIRRQIVRIDLYTKVNEAL
eukprot:CAMPEP_0184671398 /NCGR_PEP_ID=MMETSP0308-20130426/85467_1 /TAXON_ID=38269 /ORGANISM="Gloeochaete witrockiana, Strain SAG 46.84" /LENGTH=559 /DNA_ID=CAMNT_0027118509 /DNA_START=921 /DNA_END=2600 /DNA_ORIENTATION=-